MYRSLSEVTFGIIGVGEIGQVIAEKCKLMGMTVNTVHRHVPSEKLPFADNCFELKNLPECLKQCDYFCNVLPSTSVTRGLLSGNVFESCKELSASEQKDGNQEIPSILSWLARHKSIMCRMVRIVHFFVRAQIL